MYSFLFQLQCGKSLQQVKMYSDLVCLVRNVKGQFFSLICKPYGRPVLCSEWMARTRGSDYPSILPFFKENKIGCFSYGLVNGKQQCQYPWNPVENGEPVPFTEEPSKTNPIRT